MIPINIGAGREESRAKSSVGRRTVLPRSGEQPIIDKSHWIKGSKPKKSNTADSALTLGTNSSGPNIANELEKPGATFALLSYTLSCLTVICTLFTKNAIETEGENWRAMTGAQSCPAAAVNLSNNLRSVFRSMLRRSLSARMCRTRSEAAENITLGPGRRSKFNRANSPVRGHSFQAAAAIHEERYTWLEKLSLSLSLVIVFLLLSVQQQQHCQTRPESWKRQQARAFQCKRLLRRRRRHERSKVAPILLSASIAKVSRKLRGECARIAVEYHSTVDRFKRK